MQQISDAASPLNWSVAIRDGECGASRHGGEGGNSIVADGNDEDEDEKISLPGLRFLLDLLQNLVDIDITFQELKEVEINYR